MVPISQQNNTLSLNGLNPQAFKLMAICGHRVVSIEEESSSKFKVNTECTNGIRDYSDEPCKGFMQFRIKQTGTKLYLGRFDHHERCQEQTSSNHAVIEDIEENRADFNSSWMQIISEAKSSAEAKLQKAREDRKAVIQWARENNGAYSCTPHEIYAASETLQGVIKLEAQFQAIFQD